MHVWVQTKTGSTARAEPLFFFSRYSSCLEGDPLFESEEGCAVRTGTGFHGLLVWMDILEGGLE